MEELAARLKHGDQEAFAEFVTLYEKPVYNYALRQTGNAHDAQDAAQEVFLRAWRGLERFRGECALRTWVFQIAVNVCVDLARRRVRRPQETSFIVEDDGEERTLELPDWEQSPETALARAEQRRLLQEGLSALPEEQRRIVVLRHINGLSYQEIADVLGLSEGTVKSRLSRARDRLCAWLKNAEETPKTGNKSTRHASNTRKGE